MPFNQPVFNRWTTGEQQVEHPETTQLGKLAVFGLGVGAVGLLGRTTFKGQRGFDYLNNFVRKVEEYSPGHIFRTFQLSHMLSGLETVSQQTRFISPEIIMTMRQSPTGLAWLEHTSRLIGQPITKGPIIEQGLRFQGGKLYLGSSNQVLLEHAGVLRTNLGSIPQFQTAYARSLAKGPLFGGAKELSLAQETFLSPVEYLDASGKIRNESFMFTGGKTRFQAGKRFLFGYGTSLAERFNQLARAPFEMEPIASIFKNLPLLNKMKLDVIPSSGLKTFAKLTGKIGIGAVVGSLAYKQLDYMVRESSALDKTIFAEGITAGLGTLWTRGQVSLSRIAEYTGLHDYRETQEKIAPGSTELSRLAAFPILGIAGAGLYGYAKRISRIKAFTKEAGLSLSESSVLADAESAYFKKLVHGTSIPDYISKSTDQKLLNIIEDATQSSMTGWHGRIAKRIAQVQNSSTISGTLFRKLGNMTPGKINALIAGAVGLAMITPFIPGALIPSTRPEELERIYSGQQPIPVRKGRWWEFGRSPYEGENISYYKPHWYPLMITRAREKAIWGEQEPSPLSKFYQENFTYNLERMHYYDRPYPITGTAFEDIPFIGPVLSATIGKLFKPPKLMHTEEWMRQGEEGEQEVLAPSLKFRQSEEAPPGYKTLEKGIPISPYGIQGIAGEQAYRLTEMIGLPGFTMTSLKKAITGEENLFSQRMQLESANRIAGAERSYWDLELGGMLGTSEIIRRLYPHRRREIELYNPIPNMFAGVWWMPGEGQRSPDFTTGDPYSKIPMGEVRLPGLGYETLHPELKGLSPAEYPLMTRFEILADVAPYSDEYKRHLAEVRSQKAKGMLSKTDLANYQRITQQLARRKKKKEFSEYEYLAGEDTPFAELIKRNKKESQEAEDKSIFRGAIGAYWEALTHGAETPFEYLTPISPAHKLIHMRSAIEDYEANQVYGTKNAFWDHPIRDFLTPMKNTLKHSLGWEGIPEEVQDKRNLEDYFDALTYVKARRLKNTAQIEHDTEAVKGYEEQKRQTLLGLNPFTMNFSQIMRALPSRERDYFSSFASASMEDRARIFSEIPENEKALYAARWKLKDAADMQAAIKQGLLSEKQIEASQVVLQQLYEEKTTEGFPKTQELWAEYLQTRLENENYPDWYRRTKLLEKRLHGMPLPGPDWAGWNPAVDLEDIKLKIVENEGKNIYDYNLWPDRQRLAQRKPYLEEIASELQSEEILSSEDLQKRIRAVLTQNNLKNVSIFINTVASNQGHDITLDIEDDRQTEIQNILRRGLD